MSISRGLYLTTRHQHYNIQCTLPKIRRGENNSDSVKIESSAIIYEAIKVFDPCL